MTTERKLIISFAALNLAVFGIMAIVNLGGCQPHDHDNTPVVQADVPGIVSPTSAAAKYEYRGKCWNVVYWYGRPLFVEVECSKRYDSKRIACQIDSYYLIKNGTCYSVIQWYGRPYYTEIECPDTIGNRRLACDIPWITLTGTDGFIDEVTWDEFKGLLTTAKDAYDRNEESR